MKKLLALIALVLSTPCQAMNLVVDNLGDTADGNYTAGNLTLREAIFLANGSPEADSITFATAGTVSIGEDDAVNPLTFGPTAFVITRDLTITGNAGGTTIDGQNQRRLFDVRSGVSLTLDTLTLSGGHAVGSAGAISQTGGAGGGAAGLGGAIFNQGTLTVRNSTLTGNVAQGGAGGRFDVAALSGGGGGGGLGSPAPMFSTGRGGGAGGGAAGGAGGASSSAINGNPGRAGGVGGGGGGGSAGRDSREDVTGGLGGLGGFGGGGGGGGRGLSDGLFAPGGPGAGTGGAGGRGGFGGGGGAGANGTGRPSTGGLGGTSGFGGGAGGRGAASGTTAAGDGGGGGGGGAGLGGALFNHGGTVVLSNSTLVANSALGGSGGTGIFAANHGLAGAGLGGAIFNLNGTVSVTHATLSGNTAAQGGQAIYSLAHETANGIAPASTAATLANSILAETDAIAAQKRGGDTGSSAIHFTGPNVVPSTISLSGGATSTGTTPINADPLLAALASYGGPTQTRALLPGSPAINAGASGGAPTSDQRGIARVDAVDIGAFESRGHTLAIQGGNHQVAGPGVAFAQPLTVRVTALGAGEPVSGGVVSFTAPGSGASATLANNPASINGSGVASTTATANTTTGSYTVSATSSGATVGVDFALRNAAATVRVDSVTVTEGDVGTVNAVFTVTRSNPDTAFSVNYATASGTATSGTDFTAASGTLNFAAGPSESLSQTVTVSVIGDGIDEADEQYTLTLSGLAQTVGTTTIVTAAGTGTITDDDTVGITVTPTSGLLTTEAGGTASFTVVLDAQPSADVTVDLSSNDTTEGTVSPTSLTFTAANWNTARTVTVTGVDDLIVDGNVGYTIVTAAASTDPAYAGFNVADVGVSNADNDTAGVTVLQSGGNTAVTEGGVTDTLSVMLTSQPIADVTVAVAGGAQLMVAPSSLTFTAANWNSAQMVTVSAANDGVVEGAHSGTLGFGVASTDPAYGAITLPSITASITDNDMAVVSFAPASVSQSEASSPMVYTVTLSNPVASGVTVTVSTASGTATAGSDYTAIVGGSVTFAPGSTTAQTVSVAISNDALDEDNETYTLTLSGINATGEVTLGAGTATGTIEDDDALPVLSVANVTQAEGNAVNTLTFTVNLTPASGRAVSFTRATVDGTAISTGPDADFVAIAGSTVTIPAGQTSLTIPVTINGDATFEGDEQFTLSLTGVANATPGTLSATATLTEDDQQPTTTTITADLPDPSVVGQPYPVTVEVRAQTLSPLGTVSITDGTGASCTAPLTAGTAPVSTMTCTLTSTSAGAKTLTATYTPASTAFGESSDTEAHTVNAAATSLVLLGPARARIGTAASYTAELSVTAPGAGTPAGVVTVSAGANSCTITLPTATPSCTISYSMLGARAVSATFAPGNGNYAGSTSTPVQTLVFASSDVSVTKTNAVGTYRPGDLLVYTVVVRNNGPDAAPQVRIRDVVPAGLANVAWTCAASGAAICPESGGAGTLDHVVATLPSNGVLTYAYFGNVTGRPLTIVNVAEVSLPVDTTIEDPNAANNRATDTDLLDELYANGFEAPGINAESGGFRLPGTSLRSALDEVARVTYRLSDVRGEALRVYARVVGGELQVALALRGADGSLRLGNWQTPAGEPDLTWTATPTAGGWVLSSASLR